MQLQQTSDKKLSLLTLTWPIFLENLLRFMLGNVNIFMLSRYSDQAVAAVGVSNQIMQFILTIITVIAMGTSIIVSQYLGAKEYKIASRVVTVSIITNFTFGLVISMLVVIFARNLLAIMHLPLELMDYAYQYMVIVGGAMFLQGLIATISAITRSYGYTRFSMYVAVFMNVINATCTYIVIFRPFNIPDFGVRGVAVSQVISLVISVCILLYFILHKLNVSFDLKDIRLYFKEIIKKILKIGLPAAAEAFSYSGTQTVTTYIITFMGATALTSRIYVQSVVFFVYVLGLSIGHGTLIMVGRLVGAGLVEEAYKVGKKSLKLAVISNISLSLLLYIFRNPIIGIFTKDPAIIELFSYILLIDIIVEIGRALNHINSNFLRGAGDVKFPVLITVISTWGISITFAYVFGIIFNWGLPGVWLAFCLDEWCRGLVLYKRFQSGKWTEMVIVHIKSDESDKKKKIENNLIEKLTL